jgi:hypothetical protein
VTSRSSASVRQFAPAPAWSARKCPGGTTNGEKTHPPNCQRSSPARKQAEPLEIRNVKTYVLALILVSVTISALAQISLKAGMNARGARGCVDRCA